MVGGGVCAGGVSAVEVFGVEEVGAVGGCKCILAWWLDLCFMSI